MQKKWLAVLGAGVLLGGSVIGMGLASANTAKAVPPAPQVVTQLAGTVHTAPTAAGEVLDNEEKETVDKDNIEVQEGSQVEDEQGADKENEAETGGEEPGENLPGGGHADPEGANVAHDFQGVE